MSDLTASELLTAYDKFMSGAPISRADEATARAVAIAACFGVAAYDAQPHPSAATHAMARSFLLALINPAHPDLDYLRASPAAGEAARDAAAILRALQSQPTPQDEPGPVDPGRRG